MFLAMRLALLLILLSDLEPMIYMMECLLTQIDKVSLFCKAGKHQFANIGVNE